MSDSNTSLGGSLWGGFARGGFGNTFLGDSLWGGSGRARLPGVLACAVRDAAIACSAYQDG